LRHFHNIRDCEKAQAKLILQKDILDKSEIKWPHEIIDFGLNGCVLPLTLLFLSGCESPIFQLMGVVPLILMAKLLFIFSSLTWIQLVCIGPMITNGRRGAFLVLFGVIIREHVKLLLGRLEYFVILGSFVLLINPLSNGKLESLVKHRVQPVRVCRHIPSAIVYEMLREQDLSWLQLR
jgi:hypothetical protein